MVEQEQRKRGIIRPSISVQNLNCNSLLQNDKPNFNAIETKMFKKIKNTVKFKDFSKTKGFNSEKKIQ
jgi:hypothetical protein